MAVTLDQTIAQKQHSFLSRLLSSQTFWVVIAVILACLFLSFATDSFATSKNLYNITRNVGPARAPARRPMGACVPCPAGFPGKAGPPKGGIPAALATSKEPVPVAVDAPPPVRRVRRRSPVLPGKPASPKEKIPPSA